MSCRKPCGSCASTTSAARSSSATTAADPRTTRTSASIDQRVRPGGTMPRLQRAMRPSRLMGVLAALVLGRSAPGPPCGRAASRRRRSAARQRQRRRPSRTSRSGWTSTSRCTRSSKPRCRAAEETQRRQQIDEHQRALGRLDPGGAEEREAGRHLHAGDAAPVLRRLLSALFAGPDGAQLQRCESWTENPRASVKLVVNGRYPDSVPLSTMPPQVLARCRSCPRSSSTGSSRTS